MGSPEEPAGFVVSTRFHVGRADVHTQQRQASMILHPAFGVRSPPSLYTAALRVSAPSKMTACPSKASPCAGPGPHPARPGKQDRLRLRQASSGGSTERLHRYRSGHRGLSKGSFVPECREAIQPSTARSDV